MIERLGLVAYWAGCAVAVASALFAVSVFAFNLFQALNDNVFVAAVALVIGGACWLAGRAIKFILAGY